VALEIEAATNLFNKVGEDISNYPKPAFGRGGRPFYDPSFKMPESEIIEFEKEHYIPVLSEFRGRMKAIAEKVDAWFSEYTRNQSGLDPLAAANENTRLFLLGSALEKNFNETLVAYEQLGNKSEVDDAKVARFEFFEQRKEWIAHFVRAACGTKIGEYCISEGRPVADRYLFTSYFYPLLVGIDPDNPEKTEPPVDIWIFYQQNDNNYFYYFTSTSFLSGPRNTRAVIRAEVPAFDVKRSTSMGTGPILPLLDPEFLYSAVGKHAERHPGIVAAGKILSPKNGSDIGTWNAAVPDCDNQDKAFAALPETEQLLYKFSDLAPRPSFGDPKEICSLTHGISRYLAISLKDQMYLYAMNHAAVDYLAGVRGDYKATVIGSLLTGAVDKIATQYRQAADYESLVKQHVRESSRSP
jgi:hypothetical protein